jgi:hypothetical protein
MGWFCPRGGVAPVTRGYVERVRPDLVPLSAAALVVGAMCLVLGAALDPVNEDEQTVRIVIEHSGRWLGMSIMYFGAAVGLMLGLPAIMSLLDARGHRLGTIGVTVFSIGAVGTAGYAMLMIFVRALVLDSGLRAKDLEHVVDDEGLLVFIVGWVGGFYLGVLLLAIALLLARRTARWVSVLLFVFVAMLPFVSMLGRVGMVSQVLVLAVAFTGVAIAAVDHSQVALARARPSS